MCQAFLWKTVQPVYVAMVLKSNNDRVQSVEDDVEVVVGLWWSFTGWQYEIAARNSLLDISWEVEITDISRPRKTSLFPKCYWATAKPMLNWSCIRYSALRVWHRPRNLSINSIIRKTTLDFLVLPCHTLGPKLINVLRKIVFSGSYFSWNSIELSSAKPIFSHLGNTD